MIDIIVQVLIAMLATLAFSILFSAPPRHWLFCSLTGGIGWLINIVLIYLNINSVLSCFVAALTLTFFARLFSYWRKAPVTVFLISGIFPLVPGAGIYYTAYYAFALDTAMAFAKSMETLMLSGAIVVGMLLGFALPQGLYRRFQR